MLSITFFVWVRLEGDLYQWHVWHHGQTTPIALPCLWLFTETWPLHNPPSLLPTAARASSHLKWDRPDLCLKITLVEARFTRYLKWWVALGLCSNQHLEWQALDSDTPLLLAPSMDGFPLVHNYCTPLFSEESAGLVPKQIPRLILGIWEKKLSPFP